VAYCLVLFLHKLTSSVTFDYLSSKCACKCNKKMSSKSSRHERIFSTNGRVLEERRQNLSGDVVNDILFLRNSKYLLICI
jgi:hypothetical protein